MTRGNQREIDRARAAARMEKNAPKASELHVCRAVGRNVAHFILTDPSLFRLQRKKAASSAAVRLMRLHCRQKLRPKQRLQRQHQAAEQEGSESALRQEVLCRSAVHA